MITQDEVKGKFENIKGGVKNFIHKVQTKFDKAPTDQADGVIEKPILTDGTAAGKNLVWEDDEDNSGQERRYS